MHADPVYLHPNNDFEGHLIVSIHGMGDQTRNAFTQDVAKMFARHFARQDKSKNQTTLLPLGAWDSDNETSVDDKPVMFVPCVPEADRKKHFAFAEVFWADIPRTFEKEGYRIEEPTRWARTIVERIAQRNGGRGGLAPEAMHLASFVVEEIGETLAVLRKIAALGKLGKFKREEIDDVLLKFLCDVQQVGDFVRQREKIRLRFFNRLEVLSKNYPKAQIHLIAHSEGTAVAFYSLLSALDQKSRDEVEAWRRHQNERVPESQIIKDPFEYKWLRQIHSFTTLGSPIDKHIFLWPEMWVNFDRTRYWLPLRPPEEKVEPPKIRWRNFYDYADPVGFELDTAREKVIGKEGANPEWDCRAFDFTKDDDHGFRRYPIPGKAHIDYFGDDKLFDYIIENSILGITGGKAPGANGRGYFSRVAPFLVVIVIMLAAVFVFQRGLRDLSPTPQAAALPIAPSQASSCSIFPWAALLCGMTVLSRIFRLSRVWWMRLLALGIYAIAVWGFWKLPGHPSSLELRQRFAVLAFGLAAIAWMLDFLACKLRWRPIWGLRIMIFTGALLSFIYLVLPKLGDSSNISAFALLGGWVGFLGFWWVGTLLFDLAFCWQRYINVEHSWLDRLRQADKTSKSP